MADTMKYQVETVKRSTRLPSTSPTEATEFRFGSYDAAMNFAHAFECSTGFVTVEVKEFVPGRGYVESKYRRTA